MTPAGTYVEANGLRVYYEVCGEGEPLLLIHGGTATSQSWVSHLPTFAQHFRVFAPDSRGHGRTDNPTGDLGYRLMAEDVAASIDALGLHRPLVLGYSDGGQVALELGMRYPGLAGALVLGGTQFSSSCMPRPRANRSRKSWPIRGVAPCWVGRRGWPRWRVWRPSWLRITPAR